MAQIGRLLSTWRYHTSGYVVTLSHHFPAFWSNPAIRHVTPPRAATTLAEPKKAMGLHRMGSSSGLSPTPPYRSVRLGRMKNDENKRWTKELTLAQMFDYGAAARNEGSWRKAGKLWAGGVSNLESEMKGYGLEDIFEAMDLDTEGGNMSSNAL
ncbi:hypothetical protein FRC06_004746 [Ceratobasidium sp. 370]|nr:hypothetical protein FRC06_004746 [Ceratobasidium sp. 370]